MADLKSLNMSLEGRFALITGGTRGIGVAVRLEPTGAQQPALDNISRAVSRLPMQVLAV